MRILFSILLLSFALSSASHAVDVYKLHQARSADDPRMPYKLEILNTALQVTEPVYGPYQVEQVALNRFVQRAIVDIQSGTEINLFIAVTQPEWEKKAIPIFIPIRRGLLGYRLLAIKDDQQDKFSQITDIAALKKTKAGIRQGWTTSRILKHHHFNVLDVTSLDGIFPMLSVGRIDYLPLGINEIDDHIAIRKNKINNLVVEKKLALYIKSPTYFFVSPKAPRLAERLEKGLEMMIKSGQFKEIFYRYYGAKIAQANLNERKILTLDNPFLSPETPINRKELWFDFDKEFQSLTEHAELIK